MPEKISIFLNSFKVIFKSCAYIINNYTTAAMSQLISNRHLKTEYYCRKWSPTKFYGLKL